GRPVSRGRGGRARFRGGAGGTGRTGWRDRCAGGDPGPTCVRPGRIVLAPRRAGQGPGEGRHAVAVGALGGNGRAVRGAAGLAVRGAARRRHTGRHARVQLRVRPGPARRVAAVAVVARRRARRRPGGFALACTGPFRTGRVARAGGGGNGGGAGGVAVPARLARP